MRARAAALAVVMALGLSGCRTASPPVALPQVRDQAGRLVADPVADLPARALVERRPTARSARLLEKAGQISSFCDVRGRIDRLKEPVPTDLKKVLPYARLYFAALRSLNPEESWRNPRRHAAGAPATLELTDRERDALRVERAEVVAYLARLEATRVYDDADLLTPAQRRARLTDAFAKLADGPYGEADATLTEYAQESC
jgi:hypothetical protein